MIPFNLKLNNHRKHISNVKAIEVYDLFKTHDYMLKKHANKL